VHDLFKFWLHRTRILLVHGIGVCAHTDGQIFWERDCSLVLLSIMIFLQLFLGFVLIVTSNVLWVWFSTFLLVCDFCTLVARNHKHNALDESRPTDNDHDGHIKLPNRKHCLHSSLSEHNYILSHAILCPTKISLGFIELVTGAPTKRCTCMHIIILISEIHIYLHICISKVLTLTHLGLALFIWVNYTWPQKITGKIHQTFETT